MMQFKQLFLTFCLLSLLFAACRNDDEITEPIIEEPPIEDNTLIVQTIVNGSDTLNFPFDECNFNVETQGSISSYGTTQINEITHSIRGLATDIKPNEATRLKIQLEWKQPLTEGSIDSTRMIDIMNTDVNDSQSEYFNMYVDLRIDSIDYSNQRRDFHFNTQSPDFSYEITEYDWEYNIECTGYRALHFKGNFEGTFRNYFGQPMADSIYIEVPDLEMLLRIW